VCQIQKKANYLLHVVMQLLAICNLIIQDSTSARFIANALNTKQKINGYMKVVKYKPFLTDLRKKKLLWVKYEFLYS